MVDELDKEIGTKDIPKLSAGSVLVKNITIGPPKEGSKAKIVSLHCKHKDREELVKINNMKSKKVQGNNETISSGGIWYREDEDSNMDKNCPAAQLTQFYKKQTLRELIDTEVIAEPDAIGWLAIKVY